MTQRDFPTATEVAIVGAGPSGAIAAALLKQLGHQVTVIEKQHFPRFSIGESLLPHCMEFIEQAGMSVAVNEGGFQFKNGASFARNGTFTTFDFTDKFTAGPGTTYQVQRASFDHLLARQAEAAGADIFFGYATEAIDFNEQGAQLSIRDETGEQYHLDAKFVLDASGFGRVLPRLLQLEAPSNFPVRTSVFTHIEDHIDAERFDRHKILITINPNDHDIWYWLIPFANGRCSIGVVAEERHFAAVPGEPAEQLKHFIEDAPDLSELLTNAVFDTPVQKITGYSANVTSLWGKHFALLGNAGEFLDPVFSSGVTIAMRSASMAVPLVSKQLKGEAVDWEQEYAQPLKHGVNTFRTFVDAWYDGRFQDVIFAPNQNDKIRKMICSILAGYAWDMDNPFVSESERRLNTLVELCRG